MAKFRNSLGSQLYNAQQIERYVDDQFFAFSRGNVLVATTNIGSGQSFTRTITYHPYSDGTSELNITYVVLKAAFESFLFLTIIIMLHV